MKVLALVNTLHPTTQLLLVGKRAGEIGEHS